MDTIRFLLDEHLPEYLADEAVRLEPAVEFFVIGRDAPTKGTKDPQLLIHCEENELALVTIDKSTMPGHMQEHYLAGRHTWGVVFVRTGFGLQKVTEELIMLWATMGKDEWRDFSTFLPMS